jgi:Protein of unknown function DUF262.
MKTIYYTKVLDEITGIDVERSSDEQTKVHASNTSEFFQQVGDLSLSEDLEQKIVEIFDAESVEDSEKFRIKHWVSNRSFGELIDMYENEEISKPDMQRSFVWDSLKCSRLIESIVMGLPIPPLFLLEINTNKYEIIDGFQRITALTNYVNERQWTYEKNASKKKIPAKLSKGVIKELANKKFSELSEDHQQTIRRSTVPLIEFSQLEPNNFNSKYLIFERINTGSEKLNPMQIRKSLSYGTFMKCLYDAVEESEEFLNIFSSTSRNRDVHVEAFLRTLAMLDINTGKFNPQKSGIKTILNEYCESKKTDTISDEIIGLFFEGIKLSREVYGAAELPFRRIEFDNNGEYIYKGNLNASILEAFLSAFMFMKIEKREVNDLIKIKNNLREIFFQEISELKSEENPFAVSTGEIMAVKKRFKYFVRILGD